MSESLYRKYRPQTFTEVIGQDRAVAVLSQAANSANPPQSIILTGTRGIGKTTLARIFARELGVDNADIYELDAASNNGVEDMRALVSEFQTLPIMSQKKVYIFDEVHMFSASTWSVLLKTLEEPPQHVVVIMATTDDHKIPDTIISRSTVVRLSSPGYESLRTAVERTLSGEVFSAEPDALDLLVVAGDGSFRNTLVALETVMRSSDSKTITTDTVSSVLSLPPVTVVRQIVESIAYPTESALQKSIEYIAQYNPTIVMRMILDRVRWIMESRFKISHVVPVGDIEAVERVAKDVKGAKISAAVLKELLDIESDMLTSASPRLVLQSFVYNLLENK